MSALMDQNRLSLLSLSAELLNEVYGYLCTSANPVRIIASPATCATVPARIDAGPKRDLWHPSASTAVSFPDRAPWRPCIALLFTCKQIYQEAASTMYATNTFVVAPPAGFCWRSEKRISQYVANGAEWLRQLSSTHLSLLLHVTFELDDGCTHAKQRRCRHGSGSWLFGSPYSVENLTHQTIDLKPIIDLLWNPTRRFEIQFVRPKHRSHMRYSRDRPRTSPKDITAIVRGFEQGRLCNRAQSSFIAEINVNRCGNGGFVVYKYHTSQRLAESERVYITHIEKADKADDDWIRNTGWTIKPHESDVRNETGHANSITPSWYPKRKRRPCLNGLPKNVLSNIYMYTIHPGISVDLDTQAGFGIPTALLGVCRAVRKGLQDTFQNTFRITLGMGSSKTRTSFGQFAQLRQFARSRRMMKREGHLKKNYPYVEHQRIVFQLNFAVDTPTTLDKLRIDVIDFLAATAYVQEAVVTVALRCEPEGLVEKVFTLSKLRLNVYKFLSAALQQPEKNEHGCPQITIDGYGNVLGFRTMVSTGADYISETFLDVSVSTFDGGLSWAGDTAPTKDYPKLEYPVVKVPIRCLYTYLQSRLCPENVHGFEAQCK